MSPTVPSTPVSRTQVALTILRVVLGVTFAVHGYQKLMIMGISGVTTMFVKFGVPLAGLTATLVTLVEFFGGIAMAVGLFTRLVATGFIVIMLGAIGFVHLPHGYIGPMGAELPTVLCTSAVVMVLSGGGGWTIDDWIRRRR